MNLIFVGSVIPVEEIGKYPGCSVAGNKMQLGLINGFSKLLKNKHRLNVFSYYPIAPFPSGKKLFFFKKIYITKSTQIISIPFINLPFVKIFTQQLSFFFSIMSLILSKKGKDTSIITFNAYIDISWPTQLISRFFNIPIFCLLADLPLPSVKYKGLKKSLSRFFFKSTRSSIKRYNGLIVLNENAHKYYGENIPHLTIHGGIDPTDYNLHKAEIKQRKSEIKSILYVGALIEYNGIKTLLNAFQKINNKKIELIIYGDGPLKNFVIEQTALDQHIKYMGTINNKELLAIQKEVDFLINPRPVDDFISKVTFPSKIFEYFMSGTPILSTKLDCLKDGFSEYINFIDDNEEKMSQNISEILDMSYSALLDRASKAKEFVLQNKNWDIQTDKIYEFIFQNTK